MLTAVSSIVSRAPVRPCPLQGSFGSLSPGPSEMLSEGSTDSPACLLTVTVHSKGSGTEHSALLSPNTAFTVFSDLHIPGGTVYLINPPTHSSHNHLLGTGPGLG